MNTAGAMVELEINAPVFKTEIPALTFARRRRGMSYRIRGYDGDQWFLLTDLINRSTAANRRYSSPPWSDYRVRKYTRTLRTVIFAFR